MSVIDPYIRLRNVKKGWVTDREEFVVLHSVNLDVYCNQSMTIVGPSGSGKSTLLHIIGLLTPVDEGTVYFDDKEVSGTEQWWSLDIRWNIGMVFQDAKLIPNLNVLENVSIPLLHRGLWPADQKERAAAALDKVGLSHRLKHLPNQLSGGELMRVAIARVLVIEPKLVLADEPTGTLDSKNGEIVSELLYSLVSPKTALVMVTHHMPLAEQADRILRIQDGVVNE